MTPIAYPVLPIMQCDPGCTECCKFAPCTKDEFYNIQEYVKKNGIKPIRQEGQCPLYIDGKCSVYEVRPLICRLYGHHEAMTCPRGYNVNIGPEYMETVRRMAAIQVRNEDRREERTYFTHQIAYTAVEVKQLIEAAYQPETQMKEPDAGTHRPGENHSTQAGATDAVQDTVPGTP